MFLKDLLLESFHKHKDHVAVEILGTDCKITYAQLYFLTQELSTELSDSFGDLRGKPIGLMIDNTVDWVVADLAILLMDAIEIPIPMGFTEEQIAHLLANAEFCLLNEDLAREKIGSILEPEQIVDMRQIKEMTGSKRSLKTNAVDLSGHPDVIKVIHTSGTTSNPKGVMVRSEAIGILLHELSGRLGAAARRYLSIVPFSLLIEQVSGIYLPLLHGGTTVLLPPGVKPLTGGKADEYLQFIRQAEPTLLTVPPSIVEALDNRTNQYLEEGRDIISECFGTNPPIIACGGAPVSVTILESLQRKGIEVFEGYGLSENSSVVSWNFKGHNKFGTSGKPLSYIEIRNADDGELLIKSPTLLSGYLGEDVSSCELTADGFLKTGDIGFLDEEGFLQIVGRKKSILINSSGRNVSPEWVEGIYRSSSLIDDIVVFGEGKEFLVALIVPSNFAEDAAAKIEEEIRRLSDLLPDYAQVKRFFLHSEKLTTENEFMTVTGRPRRLQIQAYFNNQIEQLFTQEVMKNV